MKHTVEVRNKTNDDEIKKQLFKLNLMYLKSKEKVAYYYENINTGDIFSYNQDICFYAASTIKILVSLYLFKNASIGELDLDNKLLVAMDDLRPGTGIIKNQDKVTEYTIRDLIKFNIEESDNTAYIKLVNFVGKDNLIEFGKSMGARHTLEGKDLFGIVNCSDMVIYLKNVRDFINSSKQLGEEFATYLSNPSFKLIDDKNINNSQFLRKYGAFEIAYHEVGIVNDCNPFYLIILTQKYPVKDKDKFINKTAKKIYKIHQKIYHGC
jgi:hypothetical protein